MPAPPDSHKFVAHPHSSTFCGNEVPPRQTAKNKRRHCAAFCLGNKPGLFGYVPELLPVPAPLNTTFWVKPLISISVIMLFCLS